MADKFQDFLDQYNTIVTAENAAKIAANQKAALAAAKLVKFNSSEPVKREKEQALFLAASEAASNLLGTSKRYRTGAASNAEIKKAFDVYTKAIAALKILNPKRATAVEKSILYVTPETSATLGSSYYTGKGIKDNPFLQSGKPFTGTYNNKKYKNGIEITVGNNVETPISETPTDSPIVKKPIVKTPIVKNPIVKNPVVGDTPAEKVLTPEDREADALAAATAADFALPETLFKNIPSLNAILKKYVNTPGMTTAALLKEIRNDLWYKQNSQEIKERYVQYYNYRDMQASGQAQGTTDYEMQIEKIVAILTKRAAVIGSAAASDPAALRKAAENLYITNRSEDQSFIDDFLAASIRTVGGMIGGKGTEGYSGQALTNYKELLRTARSNGFQISDIIPGGANEQQVLQGIASGKLDINRIIQDARKLAAQGQPQYVRDLLAQGYNLDQVFAPYRQTMAAVLEIDDPDSIDLNDPLLRSAISDKGDMNVYDFKKALRKDNRWQYTEQARQDVSGATLDILRDFGFQG